MLGISSRRTVRLGTERFPRKLLGMGLQRLLMFGSIHPKPSDGSVALEVNDYARAGLETEYSHAGAADLTRGTHVSRGVGPRGYFGDCDNLISYVLFGGGTPEFNTSGWSRGTFSILYNNRFTTIKPLCGDRALTADTTYTIDIEITDTAVSFKKHSGVEVAAVATILDNGNVWHLLTCDFGPLGMRIYLDGDLLVQDPTTMTGTRVVGTPENWRLNRHGDSPVLAGAVFIKLFGAWDQQIGATVSREIWRVMGRAA